MVKHINSNDKQMCYSDGDVCCINRISTRLSFSIELFLAAQLLKHLCCLIIRTVNRIHS